MKYLLFLVFIFLLSSCCKEDFDSSVKGDGTQINIYLIKDGQIERSQTEIDLESLELEKLPWIKHSEIDFYDWSAHIFYLNVKKERAKHTGKYFLVKGENKSLFLGYFMSPFSSSSSYFPSITAWDGIFYSNDIVEIGGFLGFHKKTMDTNIKFKESLLDAGLLKEGIKVELITLKRENSSTLKYTFKVTNLDTENIYVLDPDKMGTSRFHYYTNGVSFRKDNVYYSAHDFEFTSSDKISSNWYYRLLPGKSVTRTVKLSGYTALPIGTVDASFSFPGASHLEEGEWKKRDGRIWVGNFRTKKEMKVR